MKLAIDAQTFSHASPEQRLMAAVLHRAVLDLFGKVNLVATPEEGAAVKRDALAFLTKETGPWAQQRRALCLSIDLDGDVFRAKIVDILEGRAEVNLPLTQRENEVEVARAMWRDEIEAPKRATEARERQRKIVEERRLNAGRERMRNMSRARAKAIEETLDARILLALREGHTTLRALNFYFEGDVSREKIAGRLLHARHAGLVVKDGASYSLTECEAA